MGERQTVFSLVWKTLKVSINVFKNLNCTYQHFNSEILLRVAWNCNFVHFVIILDFTASAHLFNPLADKYARNSDDLIWKENV